MESIEGIFLNLVCLKIALLLPLTSDQWVSDSGALFEQLVFVDFFLFPVLKTAQAWVGNRRQS